MSKSAEAEGDLELVLKAVNTPEAFGQFYRRHVLSIERSAQPAYLPDMPTSSEAMQAYVRNT